MIFNVYSIVFVVLNFIGNIQAEGGSLCAGKNVTSQPVIEYCDSQDGYLIFRCCRSYDNETFIAADLMDLNLTEIPDFTQFENYNLSVIDLRSNPELIPSPDYDFLTLKYLDDLILPENFSCPGGHDVWEIVDKIADPVGNRCRHQKNFCSNLTDICDENGSYCSTNGPKHFLCLCKDGLHGYKCLRNGKFPTVAFFVSTIAVTAIASTFLYWTQRRHVKQ
ncbi:unnamed protein product [Rotaria sp. Silwood1]|nr:unnamed protein product [Rotaria sp. Silwood1]CAF3373461.1 unnamed protein product [Rotaria sp. Silwood1]CAF3376403.1 unnamed protein product [Rotaria sp. Silwood1]CAF3380480.1 unnamed protein product [Rotaria sp. Silwood1]CAF3391813.1 unnamed protein product [Rotaria sp. Silwood1]